MEIVYFGNILSRDGVKLDKKKVAVFLWHSIPMWQYRVTKLSGNGQLSEEIHSSSQWYKANLHEFFRKSIVFDFSSHYQKIFDVVKGMILDH